MKIEYDPEADALYIQIREAEPQDNIDIEDGVTSVGEHRVFYDAWAGVRSCNTTFSRRSPGVRPSVGGRGYLVSSWPPARAWMIFASGSSARPPTMAST